MSRIAPCVCRSEQPLLAHLPPALELWTSSTTPVFEGSWHCQNVGRPFHLGSGPEAHSLFSSLAFVMAWFGGIRLSLCDRVARRNNNGGAVGDDRMRGVSSSEDLYTQPMLIRHIPAPSLR